MATLQDELKRILESGLKEGETDLETLPNGHVCGHVISPEFEDMDYEERRKKIWDILKKDLKSEEHGNVSTLLTYTPEEWAFEPEES